MTSKALASGRWFGCGRALILVVGTGCAGSAGTPGNVDAGSEAAVAAACLTGWPMPNPPATGLPHPQNYDIGTAGAVLDTVTGLRWQQNIDPTGYNWQNANGYCASLVVAGVGGWRLPTVVELVSIVDFTRADPAVDADAFPNTPVMPFWTSQTDTANSGLAWYVYFKNGGAYNGNDVLDVQQVRCVLSASVGRADVPSDCYAVANGTVLDTKTTLTWQQALDAGSYAWTDAQTYCATLDLDGTNWRLPSMKELMTIVDVTRADPAIDPATFPATPSDYFWSSSPVVGSPNAAWGVNFNKGSAGAGPLDFTARVRCVRP
jgi:hypothetical protein